VVDEKMFPSGLRDQRVLAAIERAKKSADGQSDLAKEIEKDEMFCDAFQFFAQRVKGGELVENVAKVLLSEMAKKYGKDADDEHFAIRVLCSLIAPPSVFRVEAEPWLLDLVGPCIPDALKLATGVLHKLLLNVPDNERRLARDSAVELLRKRLSADGSAALARGLDKPHPCTLRNFLSLDADPANSVASSWQGLNWLGAILMEGMVKHPAEIMPQVAVALGFPIASPALPPNFAGHEPRIDYLFGDTARRAVELFTKPLDIDPRLNQAAFQLDFSLVPKRAMRWLNRQTKNQPELISNEGSSGAATKGMNLDSTDV
jgi:hypothetical protein